MQLAVSAWYDVAARVARISGGDLVVPDFRRGFAFGFCGHCAPWHNAKGAFGDEFWTNKKPQNSLRRQGRLQLSRAVNATDDCAEGRGEGAYSGRTGA